MSSSSRTNAPEAAIVPAPCLGQDELNVAFPFYFIVDRATRIVQAGAALRRLLPEIGNRDPLDHVFSIDLPAISPGFDEIHAHSGHLFKFRSRSLEKLLLKGQMLYLPKEDRIVFLGSPWPAKNADLGALGITLKDYAIHDTVPDFVLQMYSLKHALADAKKMAERLIDLNHQLEHRVTERTLELASANLALTASNQELKHEIAERKAAEETIRHLAHFDPLTGLPNRTLLRDRLDQALAARRRDRRRLAVLFIDLDRFKPINDTHGHHIGDALLKAVAQRLLQLVRESDTVSRLGGDEFIVVLPDIDSRDTIATVLEKIAGNLAAPYHIETLHLQTTPSIGVSLHPEDGDDGDTLIRNADSAMYSAKSSGRNAFHFYAPNIGDRPT